MKIYCEKCGREITDKCNYNIENYTVGRIVCPKCNQRQKRYISEGDILLFFGLSETLYCLFTYFAIFILSQKKLGYFTFILLAIVFVLYYFISKYISSFIYLKAPFKSDAKNKVFDEDAIQIKKSLSWQFLLFFAIAISAITMEENVRTYFLIGLPIVVVITYIKCYFQLKYENKK